MIFRDAAIQADLLREAATLGHVHITPTSSANKLEELPAGHVKHLFTCASLAATALFETMGAHGTNILIQDGDEVRADVYARTQEDNLGLMWEIQQGDPQALTPVAKKLSEAFWFIGKEDANQERPSAPAQSSTPASINTNEDDERVKHLRRRY